ncbi:MAG TPA: FAD/NAD(P)-binding protein, partial [Acidimicrobiales bacterium]|nr:FAD/NAD(P)-binding protein [Acidimicrobiales bacterium]
RWLVEHAVDSFDGFAPRRAYARYLRELLDEADVRLEHGEVVRVTPGAPARVALADGRVLAADAVALATGRAPGSVPEALTRALTPVSGVRPCTLVEDPWAPGALTRLDACKPERVLVVGSGLTGVDVALHLLARKVEVTLVSRHGQLPRRHLPRREPAALTDNLAALGPECGLDELRAALRADLEAARSANLDWRHVIDGLRPHTARLWRGLGWQDQRRFVRQDLRQWEVLRHRMPPSVATTVALAIAEGRLTVVAGEVAEARPSNGQLVVTLSTADGPVTRKDDAVVVATGAMWDRRALMSSPLWASLLAAGHASFHPSGIGVRTDCEGRLIGIQGDVTPDVICVGAIRQGELWESTAIPEIRVQAAAAAGLLAVQPRPVRPRPAPTPLARRSPAEAAYAEGVRRLLAVQNGASRAFSAAVASEPAHARAHAALALIATERPDRAGGPAAVASHLARARAAAAAGSSAQDRSHVEALASWCEHGSRVGTAALVDHLERVPDDALALLVLAPSIAFAGAGEALPDVWSYVDRFAGVHGEVPWYLGLLAFGRTEHGRFFDAADLAEAALEAEPGNGNAAHALAHVHYETDAHSAGLYWLDEWISSAGRTQRYRPHFHWHAALHELAIGDTAKAARRYAEHLAPPRSTGVRCLVDAGSLAWRARLHPDWIAPPDPLPILAEAGRLATAPQTAFIAFHALFLHAANDDAAAIRALDVPSLDDAPAATLECVRQGLLALLEQQPRRALDHLVEALPGLPGLGASRAQQEVVLETALASMLRLGEPGQAARLLSRHRSCSRARNIRRDAVS